MAKEINFIRPQEVYDRNTGESKVRYRSYDGNDRFIPVMDREKGVPKTMVEVTHAELKAMRDNGKLTAGALYRITDYQCTTAQENTRSAGHQFDIVLLALSENKLAEEGWAMMHDNIYDVTFSDGVTKKCYIYQPNDEEVYVVDCETLLGLVEQPQDITISENNTASVDDVSDQFTTPNLTYNYFQNSNLSAWKVWYCLDNDKSRFAWADDSVSLKINVNGDVYITTGRASVSDMGEYLYWGYQSEDVTTAVYTKGTPKIGDPVYYRTGSPSSPIWVTIGIVEEIEITNGRGVIYRLIDEWNNDCPYDFKNILYLRKLDGGSIDANGTDTYIPTFCLYDNGNDEYKDASIFAIYYSNDENIIGACYDNIIKIVNTSDIEERYAFKLPNNIILELVETGDTSWQTHSNIIFAESCSFGATVNCNVIHAYERTYTYIPSGIIFGNKQVVWEDIS